MAPVALPNATVVDTHRRYVYANCSHIENVMAQQERDKKPPQLQRVGVREFRGNLSGFLRQARLGGSFLIMSHDQVLAEIRPPPPAERLRRQPGALRGKIRIAPDFDVLPTGVLAAMEGEEE